MGRRTRVNGAQEPGSGTQKPRSPDGELEDLEPGEERDDREAGPEPVGLKEMEPTRVKLRRLREELRPRVSQGTVAKRLGTYQKWMSRREAGEPEPSVEEAVLIAKALGYAAAFLVVPAEQGGLLNLIATADPKDAEMALRLLRALPHVKEGTRDMIERMVGGAEGQASETVTR